MARPHDTAHELRASALHCLLERDPVAKTAGVAALVEAARAGTLAVDPGAAFGEPAAIPGRPVRPELVPPRLVGRRSMATVEGRAMLVHALAHIEFNAVNLALDALWRFAGMPDRYYLDWLRVAGEEAQHFNLLANHLQTLGYAYGDFPGHDSLDVLLRDEVGHVEIGNRWYFYLCGRRGLEPVATYDDLTVQYKAPVLKGPFNVEGRRAAGFTEAELARYALDPLPAGA